MQAPLAPVGGAAAVVAWLSGLGLGWLVGGVLLASVVPFTLFVLLPTNNTLLTTAPGDASETVSRLLNRWGQLHAVRSLLSSAAFLLFVALVSRVL